MYFVDFTLTQISSAEDTFCESDSVVECLAWYSGFVGSSLTRIPVLQPREWHYILCLVPAWPDALCCALEHDITSSA